MGGFTHLKLQYQDLLATSWTCNGGGAAGVTAISQLLASGIGGCMAAPEASSLIQGRGREGMELLENARSYIQESHWRHPGASLNDPAHSHYMLKTF